MTAVLSGGYTPLMMACEDGNKQAVRSLAVPEALEARNQVHTMQAGYTALALAIKSGYTEIVKDLIAKGADVNSQNNAGQSMLFLACWRKNKAMVRCLLTAGANVNTADQRGWTPLMIAVHNDLLEIVTLLLEYKPDLDAKDCVTLRQFGKRAVDRAKTQEVRNVLQDAVVSAQYDLHPAPQPSAKDCDSVNKFLDTQDKLFRKSAGRLRESRETPAEDLKKPTKPAKETVPKPVMRPSSSEASLRNSSPKQEEDVIPAKARMREELDKHIKASMNSLGAKLAAGNVQQMQSMLNSELQKADEMLQSEVDAALTRSAKEVYDRLRHNLFLAIDDAMREKGLKLGPTQILEEDWKLNLHQHRRRVSEHLEEPFKAYDQLLATPPTRDLSLPRMRPSATLDELKAELLSHVSRHAEDLESRLAKVTRGCIAKEVSTKVQKTKAAIMSQLRDSLSTVATELEARLAGLMQARITEIIEANFLRNPTLAAPRQGELTLSTISPNSPSAAELTATQDRKLRLSQERPKPAPRGLESIEKRDAELEDELLQSPQNAKPPTKRSVSEKRGSKGKAPKTQKVAFAGQDQA